MMKTEKKKNIIFLIIQIFVAACGAAVIIYKGGNASIWVYFACMALGIFFTYFAYVICRWRNLWNNLEYRHEPKNREPSDIIIVWVKVSGWSLYVGGLVIAVLAAIIL